MTDTLLFVYGTLLSGLGNHAPYLRDAVALGPAKTLPRYRLLDLGMFPGLAHGGTTAVLGELYRVNRFALSRIDRLEGHPNFYHRERLTLATGIGAWTYFIVGRAVTNAPEITSGDWRRYAAS